MGREYTGPKLAILSETKERERASAREKDPMLCYTEVGEASVGGGLGWCWAEPRGEGKAERKEEWARKRKRRSWAAPGILFPGKKQRRWKGIKRERDGHKGKRKIK